VLALEVTQNERVKACTALHTRRAIGINSHTLIKVAVANDPLNELFKGIWSPRGNTCTVKKVILERREQMFKSLSWLIFRLCL
jgi:hypothetical protein